MSAKRFRSTLNPHPRARSASAKVLLVAIFSGLACLPGHAQEIKIVPATGSAFFTLNDDKATDFSGLSWVKGDDYFAVSDKARALFPLTLHVDPATGRITEGSFGTRIPVTTTLGDFEGIAYVSTTRRLFISAEKGHGIFSVSTEGGDYRPAKVPKIYARARPNKSFESLTFGAGAFWTANEEALECDGPVSNENRGTLVRLQKFDSAFRPVAQFAYRTDRCGWRVQGAGTGVSDLLALPNGALLALERVITHLGLAVKIYRIDVTAATDVSKLTTMEDETKYVPAVKTLLFEHATFTANFEGITLGPELEEGWRSLILIADSAGAPTHMLMALRIRLNSQ